MKKLVEILDTLPKVCQVCVAEEADMEGMQKRYPSHSFCFNDAGLKQLAVSPDYGALMNTAVGFRGLAPTLTAIDHGKTVVLANKESLITEDPLVKRALKEHPVALYPINSRHSAISQRLQGDALKEADKLIIAADGGSFCDCSHTEFADVIAEEALQHPNWDMGERITIDSTTMMSRGFEATEIHYLFGIPYGAVDVMIHRESTIRFAVQYRDRMIMAQLGIAGVHLPIQYASSYPSRLEMKNVEPFDSQRTFTLHFTPASEERYPLLKLAFAVDGKEGSLGVVMNSADEEVAALFLDGGTGSLDIEHHIIKAVEAVAYIAHPSLEEVIESDAWVQEFVHRAWKGGMCTV